MPLTKPPLSLGTAGKATREPHGSQQRKQSRDRTGRGEHGQMISGHAGRPGKARARRRPGPVVVAGPGRSVAAAQLLLGLRSPERLVVVVPVSVVVAAPGSAPDVVVLVPEDVLGTLGVVVVLAGALGVAVVVVVPAVAPLVPDVSVPDPPAATLSPACWTLSAALLATCSTRAPRLPGALSRTCLTCGLSSSWRALAVICS